MMPDKEKVIKGLECCQIGAIGCQTDCPYSHEESCKIKLTNDALSLLKEQETANIYKCPNCGTWVSAENVVRCKDCIHFTQDNIPMDGCGFCELLSRTYSGNDYCSYGERRTDDA